MAVAGAGAFLVAVSWFVLRRREGHPYLFMGWCWYLGNLVPSIGIFRYGVQAMADRYTYIPLIGIFIMLAWGLPELAARATTRSRWSRPALCGAGVAVFISLPLCTLRQMVYWKNGVTLFTHAAEVAPSSAMAHCVLAGNLSAAHDYPAALVEAEESLRLAPRSAEGLEITGYVLRQLGRFNESRGCYERALAIDPNHKKSLYGLASLLSSADGPGLRDGTAAIPLAKKLCELTGERYPKDVDLLGCAYAAAGKSREAKAAWKKALTIAQRIRDYPVAASAARHVLLWQGGGGVAGTEAPLPPPSTDH